MSTDLGLRRISTRRKTFSSSSSIEKKHNVEKINVFENYGIVINITVVQTDREKNLLPWILNISICFNC